MNVAVREQNTQQYQQSRLQQNIPSVNQLCDPIPRCLKVSPNLFTPEKLNIFDTVVLYTTLINCSQHIEQGERLKNLSWRIINKALLKNKSINKSKKRDGVKNLYYVLNPVNNNNNSQNNTTTSNSGSNNISGSNVSNVFNPTINSNNKSNIKEGNKSKDQFTGRKTTLNDTYRSSSGLFSLLGQRYQHHENFKTDNNHNNNNNNKNTYLHLNENQKTRNDTNSNGKHPIVVTGFDTNTLITKTKTIRSNSGNNVNDGLDDSSKYSKYNKNGNDNNNTLNLTRQQNSLFTYSSSKYNTDNNNTKDNTNNHNHNSNRIFFSSEDEDEEDSEWNSLSSDEDAYDYDDYSDDDNSHANSHIASKKDKFVHEDDEEDDDQYYKRQWNKLVFTKQSKLKATVSPSDSISSFVDKSNESLTPSNSNDQIVRKSLLSGLFSNEKSLHSNQSTLSPNAKLLSGQNSSASSLHHHHHVLPTTSNITHLNKDTITPATTTVTAHGSVTSTQGPMNAMVPLEEMMQRERRGRQMNRQLTTTTVLTDSRRLSRKSSYNSLFSEEDEEDENVFNDKETLRGRSNIYGNRNHDKQSNAPLTAQTILPTALSTHMFLPNSIIQQRRASRNGNNIDETRQSSRSDQLRNQSGQFPITRRESIDIPIKNRGHLFLKTRMEISEEKKYIRRNHLGNAN